MTNPKDAGEVLGDVDFQEDVRGVGDGSRGERSSRVAESSVMGNWLAIEVFASSPGFILRKFDLLRRGDVPLRGGVFGVQKTPSHKP